ncbi:MAG: GNAT family N-acetyltransferase [Pyrinomonadaceae bacterium]
MNILETDRLRLRELDADQDAGFVFELLNTPKFIKYIGDRGVRSDVEAAEFIDTRYRQSYRDHGYGLYAVELRSSEFKRQIGMCGFVRRDTLPAPDLGFAFLPDFEGQGFGYESARAIMHYGRESLKFERVLAITSLDNDVSGSLLEKLGFNFESLIENGAETLKLYGTNMS